MKLLNPQSPMKLRLDCFAKFVEGGPFATTDKWATWITHAERIRSLRNDYAHGRWVFNDAPGSKNFLFVPLGWNIANQGAAMPIAISPEEIDARSSEIWDLIRSMDDMLNTSLA